MPRAGPCTGRRSAEDAGAAPPLTSAAPPRPITTLLLSVQERIKRRSERLEFSRRAPAPRPAMSMRAARTRILPARSSWKDPKSLDTVRSATAWGMRSQLSRRATIIGRAVAGP